MSGGVHFCASAQLSFLPLTLPGPWSSSHITEVVSLLSLQLLSAYSHLSCMSDPPQNPDR